MVPASLDVRTRLSPSTAIPVTHFGWLSASVNTLPMSKPILVYTALTSFAWPWSDFILPNMLLKNRELWTVAVGLTHLGDTEFARFAAGAIFIAVPIVILYFSLSKFLVAGVSDGAVK